LPSDSPPLKLDFSSRPALSIEGLPAFSTNTDFTVETVAGSSGVTFRAAGPEGVVLERRIQLGEGYLASVSDTVINGGTSAFRLEGYQLALGPMFHTDTRAKVQGVSYLGVDTIEDMPKARTQYWGQKKIPSLFGVKSGFLSCAGAPAANLPLSVTGSAGAPVLWVAAKNQFFVQILAPDGGAADAGLFAERDAGPSDTFSLSGVSASVRLKGQSIEPGGEWTSRASYYVGPKKYDYLKGFPNRQAEVMEFGWFSWFCKVLLWTLNALHRVIPNYGIAIILLTAIVRVVFWPVTRKSTESMKKMQDIQPEVAKLKEKFKNDQQKMNQAVMILYKQHNVNPMMGCLPMLLQIPVFFALYVVLRSAVELRFASFLWIRDLSEPEGLLAGSIPLVGDLNILPLLMTATMIWQQHLTPTSGDPQQKKIMMLMPVFFLFLFYGMPSALNLYWTVSQLLAIAQLLHQQKKPAAAAVAVARN
jgi:YidC/Oxa1 family membrane protein insertase